VLTVKDAMALVALRGRLFEKLPEGAMLSMALSESEARALMGEELSFAAVNAPALCVASGPAEAIGKLEGTLRAREIEHTRVHINVAAHSAMVQPILGEFEAFCRRLTLRPPRIPFASNLTGEWITDREATDPGYWVRHLRATVRFNDGIQKPLQTGNRVLVEVGPGRTLASLARQQPNQPVAIATTMRHPMEEASDFGFLLAALGRLWVSGLDLDPSRLFARHRPRRVGLPTYPFARERYWIDADAENTARKTRSPGPLHKRPDVAEWFYAPSWARAAPPESPEPPEPGGGSTTWLVFTDESSLASRLVDALRATGGRVVVVAPGKRLRVDDPQRFSIDPGNRADYDALAQSLQGRGFVPTRVVHLWALPSRLPSPWPSLRRAAGALDDYSRRLSEAYYSLIFFVQAFGSDLDALHLTIISSHMQAAPGDDAVCPEKAVLLGASKVIPREYPHITCASLDVAYPKSRHDEDRLVLQLTEELLASPASGDVALRATGRFVRRFDPIRLHPRPGARKWLRTGGAYLITGGLGGIGLTVAEHLATQARAKLMLVGRTPLPVDEDAWLESKGPADETSLRITRVRAMRAAGADVMTAAADVGDLDAMRGVLARFRARFGGIDGVFHAAGQLSDGLIALREPRAESSVLDTKIRGALVLDSLLRDERADFFVLFSSVSSILGLPGQADYSAANAFLDAFAFSRALRRPRSRTLSINWNGWQEVGMLAERVARSGDGGDFSRNLPKTRAVSPQLAPVLESLPAAAANGVDGAATGRHPALASVIKDEPGWTVFRASLRREATWLLAEHVVHGGDSLIAGTGLLDIARAALEYRAEPRAVELRDVFFIAPFRVRAGEERTLHVSVQRGGDHAFVLYGESEDETFASGRVAYVDAPPAAQLDVEAVVRRCGEIVSVENGFLVQHFMDFGPRWGCVQSIRAGRGEALLKLVLPDAYASDLESHRLHPALLDMAVGGAQTLIPGFDPKRDFYVPFSYERVLLRRTLPRKLVSHVRFRANGSKDSAIFDAELSDEDGERVATIEGFMMRRVAPETLKGAAVEDAGRQRERAALREGMTPREGLDALRRMLENPVSPQVVACTVDLEEWLQQLDAEAHATSRRQQGTVQGGGPLFTRPNLSATFVAPRDNFETELAAMWQELLGVAQVGVNDDFFELGGQSLIAVRLFHRMGKKYKIEFPLATLFEAPTIAQCAQLLRARLGVATPAQGAPGSQPEHSAPSDGLNEPSALGGARAASPADGRGASNGAHRSLVCIQPGSGKRPAFFCVHGAGGNVLNFRDLARSMDRSQPFYGLQAHGVDGITKPYSTIQQMARAYVAEVVGMQQEGPYLLGGYSGGGVVAFEMAQLLTQGGREVRVLAFIDTFHPQMPIRAVTMRTRLVRVREEKLRYIAEAIARRRHVFRNAMELSTLEKHLARGEPIPFALRDLHMTRNFELAVSKYRPEPWTGRAMLFRAAKLSYIYRDAGPAYGWDKQVLGGVEIVRVPGDHATVVLGKNAEILVRSLTMAIERAQEHPAARGKDLHAPSA
jgi:thioesterase domain-containing protein/NAD(P)-dependent dehydrogenase (short-subunit alcohol dehydrogenase family)